MHTVCIGTRPRRQRDCVSSASHSVGVQGEGGAWKSSVYSVSLQDFSGGRQLHPINTKVATRITSGIAGNSRVVIAQVNAAAKPPTGGREPKAILPLPNTWAITRCGSVWSGAALNQARGTGIAELSTATGRC